MVFALLVFIFTVAARGGTKEIDFCSLELCPEGIHVRCNNTGEFSENCKGKYYLEDLGPYQQLILDEHNYYRNLIASGQLNGFDAAARMPAILEWDDDLATNAEYNVKSCVFGHDECQNLPKYEYVGQNIHALTSSSFDVDDIAGEIKRTLFQWFDEYHDADKELIQSYHHTTKPTGHFTMVVNDRVTAVGCGFLMNVLSKEDEPPLHKIIFTCDYASSNINGLPTYKVGPAASLCKSTHATYKALCLDKINPNDLDWY